MSLNWRHFRYDRYNSKFPTTNCERWFYRRNYLIDCATDANEIENVLYSSKFFAVSSNSTSKLKNYTTAVTFNLRDDNEISPIRLEEPNSIFKKRPPGRFSSTLIESETKLKSKEKTSFRTNKKNQL